MAKTKVYEINGEGGRRAFIFCPGCKMNHAFKLDTPQENGAIWTWNGDIVKPTFNPSMLVFSETPSARCHSFVRDGRIQFLSDCFHELKSQTVDLPDVEI